MAGKPGKSGGKRPNAGRKTKAAELELQRLLDECWTDEDRRACVVELAKKAKTKGLGFSMEAVKLLMAYAYGKPVEKKEISGANGEPIPVIIHSAIDKVYGNGSKADK